MLFSNPSNLYFFAGKKSFIWAGPKPIVYITDPDLIKEVLNKIFTFRKPRGGNPLTKLLANGLFDADGDRWVKHRKIINPAFNFEKLKVVPMLVPPQHIM